MGAAVQAGTIISASTLMGDPVRNHNHEDLGTIKELMIDTVDGRIAYAVLSYGGVFGLGDKLFAVPWSALELSRKEHCFLLNIDQGQLEHAPGFDKNDWPDMLNSTWQEEVASFYGSNSCCSQ